MRIYFLKKEIIASLISSLPFLKGNKQYKNKNKQTKLFFKGKSNVQFLRCSILGFPIKFKHKVALNNEVQTVLLFPKTIKFNATRVWIWLGNLT